jgi:hypothetical protein
MLWEMRRQELRSLAAPAIRARAHASIAIVVAMAIVSAATALASGCSSGTATGRAQPTTAPPPPGAASGRPLDAAAPTPASAPSSATRSSPDAGPGAGGLPSVFRREVDVGLVAGKYPRVTGVVECDEYLHKFRLCMDKVPPDQLAVFEASLSTMRDAWIRAAATEAGRKALASACQMALDTARKALAGFNCSW